MFEGINEVAVFISAVLAVAVGSVWYSPALFGRQWMKAVGISESDMEAAKGRMFSLFVYAGVANLILAFTLAQFVNFSNEIGMSVYQLALWLSILGSITLSTSAIWEQKGIAYYTINIGYLVLVVFGMISVIAYWPW